MYPGVRIVYWSKDVSWGKDYLGWKYPGVVSWSKDES